MIVPRPTWEALLEHEAPTWERVPFVWRGTTKRGADCRGIIVGCLRATGIPIPASDGSPYETHWFLHDRSTNRYLEALLQIGYEIPLEQSQPGDILAFWSTRHDKVVHSALKLGGTRTLQARRHFGGVITSLTEPIYRHERITAVRLFHVERHLGERDAT